MEPLAFVRRRSFPGPSSGVKPWSDRESTKPGTGASGYATSAAVRGVGGTAAGAGYREDACTVLLGAAAATVMEPTAGIESGVQTPAARLGSVDSSVHDTRATSTPTAGRGEVTETMVTPPAELRAPGSQPACASVVGDAATRTVSEEEMDPPEIFQRHVSYTFFCVCFYTSVQLGRL